MKRPSIRPETRMLIECLQTICEGETLSYADIERIVGYSVTEYVGRNRLQQARKYLMREQQRVYATIIRVGLKALNDAEVVHVGSDKVRQVRSAARRAKRITLSVKDYDALPPVEKSRAQATLAVTSAVEVIASKQAVAKLMNGPQALPAPPNMRQIVDAIFA